MGTGATSGAVLIYNSSAPYFGSGSTPAIGVLNGTNGTNPLNGPFVHAFLNPITNAVKVIYPTEISGATNVQFMDVYPYLTIVINASSSSPVTSSYFNLIGSNSFSSATAKFPIVPSPPGSSSSSGLEWWGWLLISLAIVAVIVGTVLIGMRIYKNRSDTTEGEDNPQISVQPMLGGETDGNVATIN